MFVPLAVNNRPGKDHGLLERYEEPEYNNPVVRFFAPDGKELIERRDRVWSSAAFAGRMFQALEEGDYEVPPYLRLACAELSEKLPERAVFGMHCFWQGQAALGRLDGVLEARPGWLAGGEVVEVLFDPKTIEHAELVEAARVAGCAQSVLADDGRPRSAKPSDDLYHLKRSSLRYLPLTRLQALRINGALEARADFSRWLSPEQRELLPRVDALLRGDPDALETLHRPDELEELPAYRRELLALLE